MAAPALPLVSYDMIETIGKIRKRSKGRWMVDLRSSGFGRLYADRGEPLRTKKDAVRLLNQIHGKMRKGRSLESVIDEFFPERGKRHSVHMHAKAWLAVKESQVATGERSENYTREPRRYIAKDGYFEFWRGVSIYEVTTKLIREWSTWLISEFRIKPNTARKPIETLHAIFQWLREDEELDFTPPRFVYPAKIRNPPRVLEPAAQDLVLEAIPLHLRGPFLAMSLLGVRPNEVEALDVSDASETTLMVTKAKKGKRATAPILAVKGNTGKALPMPPVLWSWIKEFVLPHRIAGPLFVNERARNAEKRWFLDALEDEWNRACTKVGIQINLYNGTKHTCATEILQRAPKHVVQALLGHADLRSVDYYGRVNTTTLADAIRNPEVTELKKAKKNE